MRENNQENRQVFIGNSLQQPTTANASGGYLELLGERFYRISHVDTMEPFFMSLISSSDHWLFLSSTGGLTAGRVSAEQSLFPYYTVDKVTENRESTGTVAIFLVLRAGKWRLWEPFSSRQQGLYRVQRNLYKNIPGTTVIFEEINLDLDLIYRYAWRTGDRFGFIHTSWLMNGGSEACTVELLAGLQNLLPANVGSSAQNLFSVLLDAYKRSEQEPETGMGIFALSSSLTDLAEPSESLRATTVMQVGLEEAAILLSSQQIEAFRAGREIRAERDVRGQRGAYLVHTRLALDPGAERCWHLVADVSQDHAKVAALRKIRKAGSEALLQAIEADLAANQANLVKIIASADGLQVTQDLLSTSHHFANVLFNVMRGGVFADSDEIRTTDLQDFIAVHNPALLQEQAAYFASLPARIKVDALITQAAATGSSDLQRLCASYLPLMFSRRHGDPSRPWNQFAINLKKPDGTLRLDYQGNWRDIFQNWEALAWSYPEFIENMLAAFLNATTVDGYNPYRLTRNGVDWEQPDPHSPWSNIGYWSDHQIIYLLKLMEISQKIHPGKLQTWLARPGFSYANVPYRIKPYQDIIHDPYNTIEFSWDQERGIEKLVQAHGQDGKLVRTPDGRVFHTSLAEKLLTLLLAKLANFVPEGGIWMNTQRPEWNDANNALVGKGISVVTLCYLRRYLVFCRDLFQTSNTHSIALLQEVATFLFQVENTLQQFEQDCSKKITPERRREMMDALGEVSSSFRWGFYQHGISGEMVSVPTQRILDFLRQALEVVERTLQVNKRPDHLFHAYNILHLSEDRAEISYLSEMLEGQVAVLSSGLLSSEEAQALLDNLRAGPLYRADQNSYILYPDRELPGFLAKNQIPIEKAEALQLIQALVQAKDQSLVTQDIEGAYHFAGNLRNIKDLNRALAALANQSSFASLVAAEREALRELFESVFHHNQFTGRSGTFFAYEGLGSIYWHMVAKLLLAVQENAVYAKNTSDNLEASQALRAHYRNIREGLGFHKPPAVYGAFPTDPYSHSPKGQGAKQPGMTGQVKEEILTRQAELGLYVQDGRLVFDPFLVDAAEFLSAPASFSWFNVAGQAQSLEVAAGSLAYTFCQVPILLQQGAEAHIEVHHTDGVVETIPGNILPANNSQHIFQRDGLIHHLEVTIRFK